MLIYNSLTRRKDELKPVEANKIRMYVCGMTVYDFCHLGHARMLVSFDVVQRWLRCQGYEVTYVRNVTDIDDKIIRRAVATQQRLHQVTSFFTEAMHADERALHVQSPDHEPRATRHVHGMVDIIRALEEKGLAYQDSNGDVNFRVRNFPNYGKLSGRSLDEMRAGERISISDAKEDPLDFVLWKASKVEDPEDSKWDSPYGVGRPGWHIECSAMSRDLLGMPLDIHGGGPDLKFPHHENEIAQSEGAYGGSLANLWMHCGPLMVDNDKMSKSLGNFMTIRQVIGTNKTNPKVADYPYHIREAEMLRFFIVRNHYRSQQNFAPNNLNDAQVAVDRFYQGLHNIGFEEVEINWDSEHAQAFKAAMNDDFNTPVAMAVLFDMLTQANREKDQALMSQLRALASVLGILQQDPAEYLRSYSRYTRLGEEQDNAMDFNEDEIEALIKQRAEAKASKNFTLADQIRDQLKQAGIELEDVAGGLTQWRRV